MTPAKLADGTTTRYGCGLSMDDIDGHPDLMHEGGIPGLHAILVSFTNEKLSIGPAGRSAASLQGVRRTADGRAEE